METMSTTLPEQPLVEAEIAVAVAQAERSRRLTAWERQYQAAVAERPDASFEELFGTSFGRGSPLAAVRTMSPVDVDANYLGGFMVRDGDLVRPLHASELARDAFGDAQREKDVQQFHCDGCCGKRDASGLCLSQAVTVELHCARRAAGMGPGTLRAIGNLCPHSELWAAWEVTRDTAAVAEAIGINWQGEDV